MTTPSLKNSINRPPLGRGLPRKQQLPRTQPMWIIRGFLLIPLALAWLALSPAARAVDPPPDGGYPNYNTAEGTDALLKLTTGSFNTAVGFDALVNNTTGTNNTATGSQALVNNTVGSDNTAIGASALWGNTGGIENIGIGAVALYINRTGSYNTAIGNGALLINTGDSNTAIGPSALFLNKTGSANTGIGVSALYANTGSNNTAIGSGALFFNGSGSNNIAVGDSAGTALTTGDNNIDIGSAGVAGESGRIRIGQKGTHHNAFIAGISGVTVAEGVAVVIGPSGHLGTVVSSARFKDNIKPMDKTSEAILALQPVTFRYKQELDPKGIPQFGLVAEQVEKVNPDLVARDASGKAYTVRYEAVNAMLLNEFLKEHREVQEQKAIISQLKSSALKQEATIAQQRKGFQASITKLEATVAQQQKGMEVLTASLKEQASQIQKVSAQLEVSKPTPQMVFNDQ